MLTLEGLKALGADTDDGLKRCMGNEEFYLSMVRMVLNDPGYDALRDAIARGDLEEGFERAHALKGVVTNVSLNSLTEPIIEITEDLRDRKDRDYTDLLERISKTLSEYRSLMED